jgi:hypothetical protein
LLQKLIGFPDFRAGPNRAGGWMTWADIGKHRATKSGFGLRSGGGMIGLLWFVVAVLVSPFKSKIRLEAENATLRHQLVVLRRKLKSRAHLTNNDRWFFVQLYRWFRRSFRF